MIQQTQFGDVTALALSWRRSRMMRYRVHVYVVRGVLIDSGFPGAAGVMREVVRTLQPRGAYITHHHEDHAGNVPLLAELGVPLGMDEETWQRVKRPAPIGLYRHLLWKAPRDVAHAVTPFADDLLQSMATPGHCSNHHSVWDASTGTLFAGDLYLGVKVRAAHVYENPRLTLQSLRHAITLNPARLFCAHRGFVPQALVMLRAKADWLENIVARADQLIANGWSDAEVRKELVGPLGASHYVSFGDYSETNLVAAIRRTRPQP